MKFFCSIFLIAIFLSCGPVGFSQGFVNLNFELAQLDGSGPGLVSTASALPGWTAFVGTNQQASVPYNVVSLGETFVLMNGTNVNPNGSILPIAGKYDVSLYGGVTDSGASISQTAVLPASASSLLFEGQSTAMGNLVVSLGGQNLSFFALSPGPNYTLYTAEIPNAMAGQLEQLEFFAPRGNNNLWSLDNIQFSSLAVPEPGVLALSAIGSMFFLWHRRKNYPR